MYDKQIVYLTLFMPSFTVLTQKNQNSADEKTLVFVFGFHSWITERNSDFRNVDKLFKLPRWNRFQCPIG
jgi:hypothetical protein